MVNTVQEVKARNLQTLMAVLDEIGAAEGLASDHTGRQASAEATGKLLAVLNNSNLPRQATVLLPPQGNRLTLSVGGMPLEVVLPDTLASAAKTNPALLARGTVLQVEIDPQTGVLRLSLPTIGMPGGPATLRNLSQNGSGPSASPAPPLPDHFPPGSPGALIQKLAQIHLPLGERADARATGGLAGMPGEIAGSGPQPSRLSPLRCSMRACARRSARCLWARPWPPCSPARRKASIRPSRRPCVPCA